MLTIVRSIVRRRVERKPHRLIGDDHESAEEILQCLLGGKRKRDAADAEAGQGRSQVETGEVEKREGRGHQYNHLGQAPSELEGG
jgi:hypothetical protein